MVRTRHNGDPSNDAVTPPRFLTLEERRSTKSRIHTIDADGNESDHNGVDYDGEHSIFEEKIVESRLRPRVGPRRAYNYVYEDSSDDDTTLLMSWRTRKARVVNETSFQMSGSRRQQHKVCKLDHTSEEDQDSPSRCSSKKLSHVPVEREDDDELSSEDGNLEENFNSNARRTSTRPRKVPLRYCVVTEKPTSQGLTDGNNVEVGGSARTKRHQPSEPPENADEDYEDMYSRVKRPRNKKTVNSVSNTDASTDEGDDEEDTEDEAQPKPYYSLRQRKPRTLYSAPVREASKKKPKLQETPPRTKKRTGAYRSPAHRSSKFRKQEAFHGSSSSTSSEQSEDGPDTTDEQRFSRRRERSIVKAKNRIMPLNFSNDTVAGSAVKKDRVRAGASLADIDPMEIDTSVTFDSIGGLAQHLMVLKEMIVFPLLYPEFYKKFNVTPCRGVIFHGSPGTGKTLVARALANECSRGSERVAFFMRKGADCLSKWVGEAERQLRLLFDKAYEMRPSIIFFDEIDGLAPVRSSRQDQIHSSIVSTLLALMDGLDSRGEIIVIGATNRIDAIDPGLRRPGRFDKEFHFPLPNLEDRKKILRIHTRDWKPGLCDEFISELALRCAGYCGADIKCLVTDATQNALRRHYPQIYTTSEKLQIDVDSITLSARDFAQALAKIVPTAHRAASSPAMPLESSMQPLLKRPLSALLSALARLFPYAKLERKVELLDGFQGQSREVVSQEELTYELSSDEEENTPSIFVTDDVFCQNAVHGNISSRSSFIKCSAGMNGFPKLYRPRMLVAGESGQGQTVHLAPAALHLMEDLPVYTLSAASIFGASARLPEEECTNVFREAERTAPSIMYMPSIEELWTVASDTLRSTFLNLVRLMQPSTPVLLFATSELPYSDLDGQLKKLFNKSRGQVVEVEGPTADEIRQFFSDLILLQPLRPPPTCRLAATRGHSSIDHSSQDSLIVTHKNPSTFQCANRAESCLNYNQSAANSGRLTQSEELSSEIECRTVEITIPCMRVSPGQWISLNSKMTTLKEKPCCVVISGLEPEGILTQSRARRIMQELPKAAPPEPRKLTEPEEHRLFEQEEDTLRELRIFLREILSKLWREKKFSIFTKPVDREEVPDYYDIIKNPIDLSMVMSKIDQHKYTTAAAFMEDIYLICSNALEYNPVKGSADRQIRHRACALRDTADALLKAELDPEFEKICLEISQSRKRRGVDSSGMVPAFCHTHPLLVPAGNGSATSTSNNPSHVLQAPEGSRYSRRVRGLDVDSVVPLDLVEKSAQVEKSLLNKSLARDNSKDTCEYQVGVEQQPQEDSMDTEEEPIAVEKVCSTPPSTKPCHPEKNSFKGHCENARALSSSMIKKMNMRKKCPWLVTRRRRRPHSTFSQKDSHSPGSDLEVHSADECEEILTPVMDQNSQGERAELTDHEHLSQPCVSANNSTLVGLTKLVAQSIAHRTSGCTRSSSTVAFLEASCQNHLNNTSSLVHGHDSCTEQTGPQASTCAVSSSEGSSDAVNQGPALNKQLEMELNAVAIDSGVGSSLDSNGDSRDSIEHNNNNNSNTGSVTSKRSCKKGENLADKSSAGPHTQHLQPAGPSNALHASQTVMANINVDKVRLSMLLELTVEKTRQCTVETLQELYSVLNCIIFRHRWSLNKMQLVKELEEAVAVYGR